MSEFSGSITCISHNDMDGLMSAMLVKRKYPSAYIITTNYGKTVDESKIGDVTFVTDFSFDSLDALMELAKKTKLVWIDHHAIVNQAAQLNFNPAGLRRTDVSAARLVWEYLYPEEPCPAVVQYVSDYDIWNWKNNINALYFHYGVETLGLRPNDHKAYKTLDQLIADPDYLERIVQVGKKIHKFTEQQNAIICEDGCFETQLDGINALACNIKNVNSLLFASMEEKYKDFPLRILFSYFANINKYRVSIFSLDPEKVKAHEICTRYGGGGHPGAAGFSASTLPFATPEITEEPPTFDNHLRPLQEVMLDDPIVRRCANTGNIPLVWSHQYAAVLGDYTAVVINHPTAAVDAFYSTGLSNHYSLGIFAFMTNKGWYRYRIYVLDPRLGLQQVCDTLNTKTPKTDRSEYRIVGNAIWCYQKHLPVL